MSVLSNATELLQLNLPEKSNKFVWRVPSASPKKGVHVLSSGYVMPSVRLAVSLRDVILTGRRSRFSDVFGASLAQ